MNEPLAANGQSAAPIDTGTAYDTPDLAQRQRVLRNTYWLLAVSLVPTVAGAWVGVSTGIVSAMGPVVSMIVFLAGAFGLMFAIERKKDSAAGVYLLLGFTFFMGLMLSRLVGQVLGLRNGASLVMTAFGGTAAIFFAMATLATVIKRDLSGMAKFLFVGALIVLVAGIANVFLQSSALMLALLVLCLGIFSAFMLVDIKRVLDGGETNYISATLAIYLDIYNVFHSLLALLGIFGGERD
jgi:modulator of FtsH protease